MKKIAVFPGSFDPFTIGHESIVRRAIPMFDKIIVALGRNSTKNYYFSLEQRIGIIKETFADSPSVSVEAYDGLTVAFCKQVEARYILRGLRTAADFEYERAIAQMNQALEGDVETVFLLTLPEHNHIASTIVREILKYKGDVAKFLPESVNLQQWLR